MLDKNSCDKISYIDLGLFCITEFYKIFQPLKKELDRQNGVEKLGGKAHALIYDHGKCLAPGNFLGRPSESWLWLLAIAVDITNIFSRCDINWDRDDELGSGLPVHSGQWCSAPMEHFSFLHWQVQTASADNHAWGQTSSSLQGFDWSVFFLDFSFINDK